MAQAVKESLIARSQQALSAEVAPGGVRPEISTFGCRHVFRAPGWPINVRANVDCRFRFQSEEWVAVNPTDGETSS